MFVGKIKLENNVLLAPMSGVSDLPFRKIVKKFKPGLVFSEMIASRALIKKNKKTLKMAKKNKNELLAIQIAGCESDVMSDAAKLCEDIGADIVDINMGCPVKKVVNGFAGSALMKKEQLAENIIKSVTRSVKIPVTLKMRTGWNSENRNAPKLAEIAEDNGIKMITVHGRTRCQMFKGKPDWKFIKEVKKVVKIPLVANGDIITVGDVHKVLKQSSADAIMIGRASYGKPWIFGEVRSFLDNKEFVKPDIKIIKSIILEHFELSLSHYGVFPGIKNFRKHLGWYSKSFKNSNSFRNMINSTTNKSEVLDLINSFFVIENQYINNV